DHKTVFHARSRMRPRSRAGTRSLYGRGFKSNPRTGKAEAERGIVIQFRVARRVAGSQAQEEFNFSPRRHGVHDDARSIPSGLRGETGHDGLRGMAVPAMIQNLTDL